MLPKSIDIIPKAFLGSAEIGSVSVVLPDVETPTPTKDDSDSEYDEDEQLYKAINHKKSKDQSTHIPILQLTSSTLCVITPNFQNVIINNLVARKLVSEFQGKVSKSWITLSPCSLNNGQTLNKLDVFNDGIRELPESYNFVPYLKPPHFITGIGASFNSVLNITENSKFVSLVLNADGQPGYEKLDNDSIVDAAYVLVDFLIKDQSAKEKVLGNISKSVRKFTSYSGGGMYL